METTLIAPDIECGGCAASIEKALARQDGVQSLAVDIGRKAVTVGFDDGKTSRAQIVETLTDIGFPPSESS